MSIVIKGMKIPHSCSVCQLNYNQHGCIVTGTIWWSGTMVLLNFNYNDERLYNCPLVELPEHHGRLIDADVLATESLADGAYGYVDTKQIYDAPTIIEAEGADE